MELEKTVLQSLIDRKSDRLLFDTYKGKSVVGNNFVKDKVDYKYIDFVKCFRCDTALKWKSQNGTGGLRAHVTSCTPLLVLHGLNKA